MKRLLLLLFAGSAFLCAQNTPRANPYVDDPPPPPVPDQLTIPAGTYLTVRVDDSLSSDHNQQGDAFTASLAKPLVVNGVVVAQPGETIGGQVTEANKGGRVQGVARLGVTLTDLNLVDGQNVRLKTQLISRSASTAHGRDAGAIAGTTGLGAAIGAGAGGGEGAAIGAGAGALASTIGVLITRGHKSEIDPEELLTFRIQEPVTFSTVNSARAFRYVQPNDYQHSNAQLVHRTPPPPPPPPVFWGGYPPYGYPWGPEVGVYWGRGRYGRGYGRWYR